MKVALRTVISERVGKERKELRGEITDLEGILNEMYELKKQVCNRAVMLLLLKCYEKKMVYATLQLGHL